MKALDFVNLNNIQFPLIKPFVELSGEQGTPNIHFEDKTLEMNFRVFETYWPEILFLLSSREVHSGSISKSIDRISPLKMSKNISLGADVITHKVHLFIEVLLYSNIFDGVWQGEYRNNRCYVEKVNSEIQYYTVLEMKVLSRKMFDRLVITRKRSGIRIGFK